MALLQADRTGDSIKALATNYREFLTSKGLSLTDPRIRKEDVRDYLKLVVRYRPSSGEMRTMVISSTSGATASSTLRISCTAACVSGRWMQLVPIVFHALGNFIMENDLVRWEPRDAYQRLGLSPERVRRAGVFNPEYVARLQDEHERGVANHRKLLWTLLMFELWHESFVETPRRIETLVNSR